MDAVADHAVIDQVFDVPAELPDTIGVGPFLKATVTVIKDGKAYLSKDVGNLDAPEHIEAFERTIDALLAQTGAKPVAVGHDLHPDFYSTRWAEASGINCVPVQHHHAHIAAIQAEFAITEPMIGLSLDGFGLGPDNESWGGELLLSDGADFERIGHLERLAQPGGDVAAREPWRMGAAALHALGKGAEIAERFADQRHAAMIGQLLDKKLNAPETSSCGRLFDAACGLLNVHPVSEFEGQAPMALEGMVTVPQAIDGGFELKTTGILSLFPTLERLLHCDAETGANLFHGTLTEALYQWALWGREQTGVDRVALCGGCFFNRVLRTGLVDKLTEAGLKPQAPERASPGDPAVSLGQAWIAAHATLASHNG